MATRAERARADGQRTGTAKKATATKRRVKRTGHTASKATFAREARDAKGRASRKSTRSSANRAKPDAGMNIREELLMSAPESRSRHEKAKGSRVRGS